MAFATTITTALLAVGLVAGASPATAATDTTAEASDCATGSAGPDGMLDAGRLQACLGRVQAESIGSQPAVEPLLAPEAVDEGPKPAAAVIAAAVAFENPAFEALDAFFPIDLPAEAAPEQGPVSEEPAPADDGPWDAFAALRDCESGGDYGINTGNGYYGAYQFSLETWQGLGYGGYPHEASPAVQDQAAAELQSLYGWGQWPGCSWYLGLG